MNFENVDPATAELIALPWLLEKLEPTSEYGRIAKKTLRPFLLGEEAQALAHIERVVRVAQTLNAHEINASRAALRNAGDATAAIAGLSVSEVLTDSHFLEIVRFCETVHEVAARTKSADVPRLPSCDQVLSILAPGCGSNFGFYLDDAFAPELAEKRMQFEKAQADFDLARSYVAQRVARAINREEVGHGQFVIMREALHGALPAELHVVREAPTYYLCELELDSIAVAALERRDAAAQELGTAEYMVRSKLCADLHVHRGTLRNAAQMLGEIDVFLAKVQFAKENAGCVPRFSDTTLIEFTQARFLPLLDQLQSQNRKYIPISLRVEGVALLSGPNMGGKSVALRTCGFLSLCASLGLPVPAARATLVLFEEIAWLGIGIDEGPGGLLSAFAKEVVRLSELLARKREPGLILIDEFARTTNPREGRALIIALIQTLRGRNVCALVATHLPGIAEKAGVPHFAVRGLRSLPHDLSPRSLDDALTLLASSMDYSISEVAQDAAGRADAIALAQILGLDQELVAAARKAL